MTVEAREAVRRTARPAPPRLYRAGQLTELDKMPPPERAITLIVVRRDQLRIFHEAGRIALS